MTDKSSIRTALPMSPLTRFVRALYSKPLEERMTSDPVKAALGYGLPLEWTTFWINEARRCPDQWPIKRRQN